MFMVWAVPGKPETVVLRELNESLREAATVSGLVVVGAILLPEGRDPEPRLAAALTPEWAGRDFCLDIISADGLYQSQSLYTLAPDTVGLTPLPYPTAYRDRLRAAPEGEISVRGRLDGCDTGGAIVPVAWRPHNLAGAEGIALQINAFRADSVQIFVGDDPLADAIPCVRAIADVRTAFDTICRFDLPDPVPDRLNIEILRLSGGRAAPPEFVELILVHGE
jgi:hypothetical protein